MRQQTENIAQRMLETLRRQACLERQKRCLSFFKTGPGDYAYEDQFIGVTVPMVRQLCSNYQPVATLDLIEHLLLSPWHELRLASLIMLCQKYKRSQREDERTQIFTFYITHTAGVNNWDLVDISAPHIVGDYLLRHPRTCLYEWAESGSLWQQRIAIVSTLTLVRQGIFTDSFALILLLCNHPHDLIHKAMGWVLREIGKVSQERLSLFLMHYRYRLPRTTLRYAIEHYTQKERKEWLQREV